MPMVGCDKLKHIADTDAEISQLSFLRWYRNGIGSFVRSTMENLHGVITFVVMIGGAVLIALSKFGEPLSVAGMILVLISVIVLLPYVVYVEKKRSHRDGGSE